MHIYDFTFSIKTSFRILVLSYLTACNQDEQKSTIQTRMLNLYSNQPKQICEATMENKLDV